MGVWVGVNKEWCYCSGLIYDLKFKNCTNFIKNLSNNKKVITETAKTNKRTKKASEFPAIKHKLALKKN